MRRRTVVILILLTLVIISSSGCMGISVPQMPQIAPIQAPVVKAPNAFVEVKDINYNPSSNTSVNITITPTPTPTPTSRFIYV
jgi:hypothetical protein